MKQARSILAVAVALILLSAHLAVAGGAVRQRPISATALGPDPICDTKPDIKPAPKSPRIQHLKVHGLPVTVLLPPEYGRSLRRYPVLFLLHGGTNNQDSYVADPAFMRLSAAEPDDRQTIVVTPYGGTAGFYLDWFDGSHNWETRIIKQVLPVVDHRYRTLPDRAHRGIAGGSMGGWGAIHLAMRHRDLFSVVGSFSGVGDIQPPDIAAVLLAATQLQRHCEDGKAYGDYDPFGMFGNPVVNESSWQAQNPALHPTAFAGMSLYLTAGLGIGCNSNDSPQPDAVETATNHGTLDFHLALVKADIPHIYDAVRCGQHTAPYFARDVRIFWPLMTDWLHTGRKFAP